MNDRSDYIRCVEAYFAALDARCLDQVLSFFNVDAVFTVQSAYIVCQGRDTGIRRMFEQYLATYPSGLHTDFEHIVDSASAAVSSRFRVELTHVDGHHETKHSVNHWYFRGGLFERVYVWISGANVLAAPPT